MKFLKLRGNQSGNRRCRIKPSYIGNLVDKGIITLGEARIQLGFPAQPKEQDTPLLTPKPKSEGQKIVEQTVKGVMEQLNERQARGE